LQNEGFQDIKVVLQTPEGKYFSGTAVSWCFTEDRASAIVFDLFGHRVQQQLAFFREQLGFNLEPVALPPKEVYETCDGCQWLLTPRQIFFDGCQFLCFDCKAEAEAKQQRKRLAA
jgi:hypothetical protein